MSKKVFLAFILLAIVIGVGYFRSLREKEKTATAYQKGKSEVEQQLSHVAESAIDSIKHLIEKQELEAARRLWQRQLAYSFSLDSLIKEVENEKAKSDSLLALINSSQPSPKNAGKKVKNKVLAKHQQALDYYRKKYQSLPKDLSPYEKEVAVKEIREETARKFSLTLDEFDKIRKKSKLDY